MSSQDRIVCPNFEDLPSNLKIVDRKGKGRLIIATQTIKPGQTLISTKPLVSVLDDNLSIRCNTCFRSQTEQDNIVSLSACSVCHTIKYCSRSCQRSDWELHRSECQALQRFKTPEARKNRAPMLGHNLIPVTAVRAAARLIWVGQKNGIEHWNLINSMISNRLTCSSKYKEAAFKLSVELADYIGPELLQATFPSSTELLDFCCRFAVNTFSLSDPFMSSIGVAVSPILALLNHSCQPNTHFVFPAYPSPLNVKPMRLLATSRIEIGEEITTSYLATALSGRKRREYLQEKYQFDCECTLCLTETAGLDLDVREALLCSDRQCKGLIPMPKFGKDLGSIEQKCNTCDHTRSINVDDLNRLINDAHNRLEAARKIQDPSSRVQHLGSAIPTLQSPSTPYPLASSSDPLYTLTIEFATSYLNQGKTEQSLHLAQNNFQAALLLYQPGDPILTLARLEIIKLLGLMLPSSLGNDVIEKRQQFTLAKELLRESVETLMMAEMTFGKNDSVVVDDLRRTITALEQEVMIRQMELTRS